MEHSAASTNVIERAIAIIRTHRYGLPHPYPGPSHAVDGMNAISAKLDARTRDAALSALRSRGRMRLLPFIGPAVIASVAYIDPGNFATNLQAGSQFGYTLLWVVLWANLMAMLVQGLSAKLGIATGCNLPEVIRDHWPKPLVWFYWVQAELVAIFTDLAEFLGAALGFHLLLGLPMEAAVVLAFAATMGILYLEQHGFRGIELAIAALVGVIALTFGVQLLFTQVAVAPALEGLLVPRLPGPEATYLAVGILGATVMPHVIYLHSSLTQHRLVVPEAEKPALMRQTRREVLLAMGLAGLINLAMLAFAAGAFAGQQGMDDLGAVWAKMGHTLGPVAAGAFAVALLASGLSSSAVGTLSGQVVMQGFVGFRISLWLRRSLTAVPALVVILLGLDPTRVLVFSQVVLSFGIPFALVPLMRFTARRELMGALANTRAINLLGWLVTVLIVALNLWLLAGLLRGG